jgi:hypothetical protein
VRALRRRYGRARKASGWQPGDLARTTGKIFADPPIYPPVLVTVEEVVNHRGVRRKDAFGTWETSGASTRVRVAYRGKSYWVDADVLERP